MKKWWHNLIFTPNWSLGRESFSGKHLGDFHLFGLCYNWADKRKYFYFFYVSIREPQICAHPPVGLGYRDLQRGGTSFGFRNKNYWVADDCLVGFVIKCLFRG